MPDPAVQTRRVPAAHATMRCMERLLQIWRQLQKKARRHGAAYGWYASAATPVAPGLVLHFAPGYVYMYKGFTHDLHRGKRLHAIGMTRALQHYRSSGFKGVVSYVESSNFDSLKSCARMGYR